MLKKIGSQPPAPTLLFTAALPNLGEHRTPPSFLLSADRLISESIADHRLSCLPQSSAGPGHSSFPERLFNFPQRRLPQTASVTTDSFVCSSPSSYLGALQTPVPLVYSSTASSLEHRRPLSLLFTAATTNLLEHRRPSFLLFTAVPPHL